MRTSRVILWAFGIGLAVAEILIVARKLAPAYRTIAGKSSFWH